MADYKNYKKTTDKLKVTTGSPQIRSLNHSYIAPFLNVLKTGFPGCAGNAHGHAINCASVHRYRGGSWWLSGRSSDFSR